MTDDELREAASKIMLDRPGITRSQMRKELHTTVDRLKKLGITLPAQMSYSEAGRKGRRASGWEIRL